MAEKLKIYLTKYKEQIMYLIFGVGTTVVNYIVFWIVHRMLGVRLVEITNIIAFIAAVTFAYITNKVYVFESRDWSPRFLTREILSFLSSRIASFLLEEFGLMLCVRVFHVDSFHFRMADGVVIAKVVLSFAVVIINYFLSKYLVFGKKKP